MEHTSKSARPRRALRASVASLVAGLVAAALTAPAAGAADPQGQITQYPAAALPGAAEAMALGPNSLLWFTQATSAGAAATTLSNLDPKDAAASAVVQSVSAPKASSTVTRMLTDSAKSAVWYVNATNTTIVRWDKNGSSRTSTAFPAPPANAPAPLSNGPIVDFTLSGSNVVVLTQTAAGVSMTTFSDSTFVNPSGPSVTLPIASTDGMVFGPDGNFWVVGTVANTTAASVVVVGPSGVQLGATLPVGAAANRPVRLIANPASGTVTAIDNANVVTTWNASTKAGVSSFNLGEKATNAIAASDGRIWVVSKDSNKVTVLNNQAKTSFDLPVNSLANGAMAEDAQGNVWVGLAGLKKLAKVGTAAPAATTTTVAATTTTAAATTTTAGPTTTAKAAVPTTAPVAAAGAGAGLCPANTGYAFTTAGNEVCVPLPAAALGKGKKCAKGQVSAYYGTGKGTVVVCVVNPGRSKRSVADQVASFAAEMDGFAAYPNFTAESDGSKTIFVTYDSAVEARRRCTELATLMKRRLLPASLVINAADSLTLDIRATSPKYVCKTIAR